MGDSRLLVESDTTKHSTVLTHLLICKAAQPH